MNGQRAAGGIAFSNIERRQQVAGTVTHGNGQPGRDTDRARPVRFDCELLVLIAAVK